MGATVSAACTLSKLFYPLDGTDDIRQSNAEFFVDDDSFASCDELAIDVNFQRLASEFVQFHDRPLAELQQFVDEQLGAAQFCRNFQRNVQNEIQIAFARRAAGLASAPISVSS